MCLDALQIASSKVTPLQAGGALMLGGEQDCYGGCTDAGQAFYGLMDEVRFLNDEGLPSSLLQYLGPYEPFSLLGPLGCLQPCR